MSKIEDGGGAGYLAKVNSSRRMLTQAVNINEGEQASRDGESYNINTGTVSLTTADESSVLYVKNNEDKDVVIPTLVFLLGNSTGGSGDLLITVVKNPTAGTVVSDASDTEMKANKNFGSSDVLQADAFKGGEGKTLTDGSVAYRSLIAGAARPYLISTGDIVLQKGSSIGIKITPQTSNTAMDVQVALAAYIKNNE